MQVHRDIDTIPSLAGCVLTIGFFDGVHKGHRAVLNELVQKAKALNTVSVLITFYPHPRHLLGSNMSFRLIDTMEEKLAKLQTAGIDHTVIVPFTPAFAQMEPEKYIKDFLVKRFAPKLIMIGKDHRYGNARKGDFALMESMQANELFTLQEIPLKVIEENKISSTLIREAVLQGNVELAKVLLGTHFTMHGTVIKGKQLGTTIGYPTANMMVNEMEKLIPQNGVYAVWVKVKNKIYKGAMNIGTNPTVDNSTHIHCEVHILSFNGDIYGENLAVYFVKKIRDEIAFASIEDLTKAIANDVKQIESILNKVEE